MPSSDPFEAGLPTLTTPRLRLRHPRPVDVTDFLRVFGDADALAYWSHGPLEDETAASDYIRQIDEGHARRSLFQWAVADRTTDRVLGTVTLYGWNTDHRRCELGFILGRAHWGQGLATEAVRRVLRFGFEAMELHRVEADVDPDNQASLKMLERLGFRREGHLLERWFTFGAWRDTVLLGLLERDLRRP